MESESRLFWNQNHNYFGIRITTLLESESRFFRNWNHNSFGIRIIILLESESRFFWNRNHNSFGIGITILLESESRFFWNQNHDSFGTRIDTALPAISVKLLRSVSRTIGEINSPCQTYFPLSRALHILSHDFSFLTQVLIDVQKHLSIFLKNGLL